MAEPRCTEHDRPLPPACAECEAIMQRPVGAMTGDERADELQHWFDSVLTVEFEKLHGRIEQLVGRPVFTHELGSVGTPNLVREARGQQHPVDLEAHAVGLMDQIAGSRPVMVVRVAPEDIDGNDHAGEPTA